MIANLLQCYFSQIPYTQYMNYEDNYRINRIKAGPEITGHTDRPSSDMVLTPHLVPLGGLARKSFRYPPGSSPVSVKGRFHEPAKPIKGKGPGNSNK